MYLHVPCFNLFLFSFFFFFFGLHISVFLSHPLFQSLSASLRYCSEEHLLQEAFSAAVTLSCPSFLPHLAHLLCANHI